MIFYQIQYQDDDGDLRQSWTGSRAAARELRKQLEEKGHEIYGTRRLEMPSDKGRVLNFLNVHATVG